MVSEIRLFFEGDKKLRPGLNAFLKPAIDAARQRRIGFQMIAGGATDETVRMFLEAPHMYPDGIDLLLIDSDRPDNGNLIASVKTRSSWNAQVGAGVQDNQIHFMVQVMESWFLADKDALERYYGRGFQPNRLPQNPNVEQIANHDVIDGLEDAARDTSKGEYHKTRHAPELLRRIDAGKVRSAAPNCDRLFTALQGIIDNT